MFRDAVVTRAAVNTLPIIVIAQVIIAVTRAASISILLTLTALASKSGLCNGVSVTFKVFLKYMKVGVPLCKFQVWSIVNHCRRFPIQGLPF